MTSGADRGCRNGPGNAAWLLLACLHVLPARAEWGLEQLMQRLGQVPEARGSFVERRYIGILDVPLEVFGTLSYRAPGRLERHTLMPSAERLVLDGDQITIEEPGKPQRRTLALADHPILWAFVESMRSTLAGDLQSLKRFYRTELSGDAHRWRLSLAPTEPGMQGVVREIRIVGQRDQIERIEVFQTNGDRSVMTVTATP